MKHLHTNADYNFPTVNDTFLGRSIPNYTDYVADQYPFIMTTTFQQLMTHFSEDQSPIILTM
jgi:hypothetical protein